LPGQAFKKNYHAVDTATICGAETAHQVIAASAARTVFSLRQDQ